jgi:hypothetical protein
MLANMATSKVNSGRLCAVIALIVGLISTSATADSTTKPSGITLDPAISATVRDALASQTFQRSEVKGGAFTNHSFEDVSPDGVLVGFHIGLGLFFTTEVIKYIQPIYLTPSGLRTGRGFGDETQVQRRVTTKAPPGYAVGAVDIRGGGGLDALTVTYMKFNGTRLDPSDVQVSSTFGGGKNGGGLLDGDGTPVIGICGRIGDHGTWLALGLIFVKPTAMVPDDSPDQTSQRTDIKGGGGFETHPFEDLSKDGALIGFRIGIGYSFNQEAIKWIAPIYLTPRGEEVGNGIGSEDDIERKLIAKAPPGYAIGAIKARAGGGGLSAITITYMKFNGTRLDPTDTRVTPRIGGGGGGDLLNGDGTPITGIIGCQDDNGDSIGLGLIFAKPTVMVNAAGW